MVGAGEEAVEGLPCGLLPPGLADNEVEAIPEGLRSSPYEQLRLGTRYTNEQVSADGTAGQPAMLLQKKMPLQAVP